MNEKKFYDSADAYHVSLTAPATLSANRIVKFPDAAGTLSLVAGTETLTNKTLTTPTIDGVLYSGLNDREPICEVVAISGALVHAGTGGVIALWTASAASIILRVILDVTTKSDGASTVDVGYTVASATTTSDTILDGIDTGAGTSFSDSMNAALDAGGNALAQKAAAGGWITIDEKSGDTTGLVANAYIFYVKI
jgi:hypothetical protein